MAADQKIAVVNFQEVMGKIPQTASIMQSLEAEFKDDKAVLVQLEKDMKYYQEKQKRDGSLMSEKEKMGLREQVTKCVVSLDEALEIAKDYDGSIREWLIRRKNGNIKPVDDDEPKKKKKKKKKKGKKQ